MDFSAPYRVITPTLEGPVLRALGGVEGRLTRGQIVALVASASEAGVRKALGRLVEQGIVLEEQVGRQYTYAVNRDHLLWPHIEGLLRSGDELRNRVGELVAGWRIAPVSIELFGSVAQGVSDERSDLDILVVQPELGQGDEDAWDQQMSELHDRLVSWTGNECDLLVLDLDDLAKAFLSDDSIVRSAMRNLAGRPVRELEQR